jgi:hypothetical protein
MVDTKVLSLTAFLTQDVNCVSGARQKLAEIGPVTLRCISPSAPVFIHISYLPSAAPPIASRRTKFQDEFWAPGELPRPGVEVYVWVWVGGSHRAHGRRIPD